MTSRTPIPVAPSIELREGDTTAFTVSTGLGKIASGTAEARFVHEDTNVLVATIACTDLTDDGDATIDASSLQAMPIEVSVRYLLTVTATVGADVQTSPSADESAVFVVLVSPGYE